MPVLKFRTLSEMDAANWRRSDDPALPTVIARVWAFADRTCPRRFPPGSYRHRTMEAARAQREEWENANFRAFWSRKKAPPAVR